MMYFKTVQYMSYKTNKINALTLIKTTDERRKMANLIKDNLKIFIRRGTGTKDEVKSAARYIHKGFDYAWGWKRRSARKVKVVKHGVDIS